MVYGFVFLIKIKDLAFLIMEFGLSFLEENFTAILSLWLNLIIVSYY